MKVLVAANGSNVAHDFGRADRYVEGIFIPEMGYKFIEHKTLGMTKAKLKKFLLKTGCIFVITGGIDAASLKFLRGLDMVPVTGIVDGVQEAVKNYFEGNIYGGGPRCCGH